MPYEFTPEGYNQFSQDILKAEGDQAIITTLLADMQGTVTDAIARDIAGTKTVEDVTAQNARLKEANMNLFLRLGEKAKGEETSQKDDDPPPPVSTRDYMNAYFDKLDKK